MFYSQIVLSKKGPLGKVWLAAHHDKKLSRPQIFAFDISDSVHNIVHPVVPLALRVSGHLLLGVVRIYSRKVHYLMEDAHEASIKISTAFTAQPTLDLVLASTKPGRNPDHHLNVANFGEFQPMAFLEGGFEIPTDLVGEDWDVADDDDDDGTEDGNDDDNDGDEPARKRQRSSNNLPPDDSLEQSQSLSSSLLDATGNHNNRRSVAAGETSDLTTSGLLNENWPAFNPDDDDEEEEENESKHSSLPEIEVTRAADNTFASDSQVRIIQCPSFVVVAIGSHWPSTSNWTAFDDSTHTHSCLSLIVFVSSSLLCDRSVVRRRWETTVSLPSPSVPTPPRLGPTKNFPHRTTMPLWEKKKSCTPLMTTRKEHKCLRKVARVWPCPCRTKRRWSTAKWGQRPPQEEEEDSV